MRRTAESNTERSKDSSSPSPLSSTYLAHFLVPALTLARNSFTAIGGNLVGVPALLGNVVLWKPSPMATYASWVILQILLESGLPRGVIQFLPCPNGQDTVDLVAKVRQILYSGGRKSLIARAE